MKIRDIAFVGILAGILLLVQIAFAFVPNVEFVSLLIILYTKKMGRKVFFVIYTFAILEVLIYGFGLWAISYFYVWSVLALVTLLFRKNQDALFWAFIAGFFGLGFGALTSLPSLAIGGISLAFSYWVTGIVFDVFHFVGNFVIVLVLYRPVNRVLNLLEL